MTSLNLSIRLSLLVIIVLGSIFGTALSDDRVIEFVDTTLGNEETRPKQFRVRVQRASINGRVVEMIEQPAPFVFEARIDEEFERLIFPQDGNAERAKWRINAEIKNAIEHIDSVCQLNLPQLRKLELIAGAERNQLFEQVDLLRRENRDARNPAADISAKIELLRERASGRMLDSDSFFAKSLRLILSESQFTKLAEAARAQTQKTIDLVISDIENQIELTQLQREALTRLLSEYDPTNTNFGGNDLLRSNSDRLVMLYTLSLISEERVKPLLAPEQWKLLQPKLQPYRSFEQHLRRRGQLKGKNIFAIQAVSDRQANIEERK